MMTNQRQLQSAGWDGIVRKSPVISIVDDAESVRVAMKNLIESLGFTAYTFSSAGEFLDSPQVEDTACLISDVQMPFMSGLELQSHLNAQGNSTPVIFITAFPDENARDRALRAGAVCFLNKPFSAQTLSKYIDEALSKRDLSET
jgi:FixJ family two-component response regulator